MQLFTPFEYLLIDVANQMGFDKDLYEDRIKWTKDNLDNLEDLVQDAESPNMYWKAVDAIRCAQAGIPTGHLVGFDSAASGIQLLSTLARCAVGMKNTGVINSVDATSAPDIYNKCTKVMGRVDYVRKAVKNALMTYFYGSEAQPKATFGEGDDLRLFFIAAKAVAPEAFDLRSILVSIWQPGALAHECVFPDHGTMYKRVYETIDYKVQEPLLGSSFTFRTKINQGTLKGVSLAADITHGIDGYLLRELNRRCNFDKALVSKVLDLIIRTKGEDLKVTDRTKLISMVEIEILNEDTIGDYTDNQLAQLKEILELSLANGSFELVNIH